MPPVHPVKGQMLLLRGEPGAVQRIVLGETRYVIPRRDGRVLVGSTMENADFDKTPTELAKQSLLASARELIPLLGDYRLERHWAGLRPGSPAGVPFIGPHPELEGLFFNAGHYRNGVVMGPASARLVADLLLGREPILNPALFSLNRIEFGKPQPQ
jgi:glycine oxidase